MEFAMTQHRIYLKTCRRLWNQKKMRIKSTPNMQENKWRQPQFHLHLITKSHSRWEVGLPTSSAAVHLWKMTPHMMLQSTKTFCEQQIYWTFPPLLCMGRLSFYYLPLLTVTVIVSYRSSYSVHHFGFICALINFLCNAVRIFHTTALMQKTWCFALVDANL